MSDNNKRPRLNSDRIAVGRRQVLKKAVMTGVVGVTAGSEFVRTAKADHAVEYQQKLFDQTVSVPRTDIEVEHVVTLTIFEGHCEQSEYRHPFDININTIAYEEGNPSNKKDEALQSQMIKLTFPDNSVEADTDSRYDVGGHRYKDPGSNLSHVVYDAIMFGAGELTPYGWVLDAGEIMTDMLTSIVEKYDHSDSIKRTWRHYRPGNVRNPGHLVPQGSGWASYIAEYEQGGWAPASLTIDLRHGFAINHPIFATHVWAYRDETSFTLWNKYC